MGHHDSSIRQPGRRLHEIPPSVRELTQVPQPLSILVWIASLFGAGALAVIEYVALPIVYLILAAFADRKARSGTIDEDEAGITSVRDLRRQTSRARTLLSHVIRETSPLRDDPPALPPGDDP